MPPRGSEPFAAHHGSVGSHPARSEHRGTPSTDGEREASGRGSLGRPVDERAGNVIEVALPRSWTSRKVISRARATKLVSKKAS